MAIQVISFHYTLTDDSGTVLDSSRKGDPLIILSEHQQIIPGLESALLNLKVGEKKVIRVAANEGYGEKQEQMVITVPRSQFPSDLKIKVGDHFRPDSKDSPAPVFIVTSLTEKEVTLDGNHPLAGKDLNFDVEITEMRAATEEELAHGHAHGPGGHHHH